MIHEVLAKLDFGLCIDFKDINPEIIAFSVNRIIEKGVSDEKRKKIKLIMIDKYY